MCKQNTVKRNVPSETKIPCNQCKRNLKFRDIRRHMSATHGLGRLTILCTLGVSCKMNWFCSLSLDCFLEHAKKEHGEFNLYGSETNCKPEDGFRFCELEIVYEKHSEIC